MTLYKISKIFQETHNVRRFQFKCAKGKKIKFKPGQHIDLYLTDQQNKKFSNKHESFSLSSPPTESHYLEILILNQGSFRHKLYNLPINSVVYIAGPYGDFIFSEVPELSPVFIAGGSGISPIMSMLRHIDMNSPEKKCTLFYTCKSENEIIFHNELEGLKTTMNDFLCYFVITRAEEPINNIKNKQSGTKAKRQSTEPINFVNGHIDETLLINSLKNIPANDYYICGPYELMIMISFVLQKLNVNATQIHSELW